MPENYNFRFFIIPTLLLATIYLVLVLYLMNLGLVQDTLFGEHTLSYKINLLIALLGGMWTAMTGISLLILMTTALLTGANMTLMVKRLSTLKSAGKLHLVVGGSSLLGIVGSGCASCGLPVLSLLGITGSLTFLPFNGDEISVLSLILLSVSLYFLLKANNKISCEMKPVFK
jgi:hypothetical protein